MGTGLALSECFLSSYPVPQVGDLWGRGMLLYVIVFCLRSNSKNNYPIVFIFDAWLRHDPGRKSIDFGNGTSSGWVSVGGAKFHFNDKR